MATTPNYGLRSPELTNDPDIPRDFQNLADDADAAIRSVEDKADANAASAVKVTIGPTPPASGMKVGDIHCRIA